MRLEFLFFAALALFGFRFAGHQPEEKVYDDRLSFKIISESVRSEGVFEMCISRPADGPCIENLFTSYETLVYDASGKEIWSGLWMGEKRKIRFATPLPEARSMTLRALKPFVINRSGGSRIYQHKPIEIKVVLR
jgi:hypothetical protein